MWHVGGLLGPNGASTQSELVLIQENGTKVVNFNTLRFGSSDMLRVYLMGLEVLEGPLLDYVKSSDSSITFNYNLKAGYEVHVILG